uniref:Photosystem I assembly protein Ycf36 n=1 Tax=Laurencieae sp. TaxID=2007162 RepID=A0A1Z1M304_9FLOR|nr:hypothetical protein [Laurencieae sp.]
MSIYKNSCPVPFDQQPLNEYLSLKKSCLFSWSVSKIRTFLYGFVSIFTVSSILVSVFLLPFIYSYSMLKILVLNFVISNIILLFIFIRLYLGWSYVIKRLLSATVFYEESGWYDGQIWVKTSEYLIQDRLVGFYQIMPYIIRIRYICCILIISFLCLSYCYNYL